MRYYYAMKLGSNKIAIDVFAFSTRAKRDRFISRYPEFVFCDRKDALAFMRKRVNEQTGKDMAILCNMPYTELIKLYASLKL